MKRRLLCRVTSFVLAAILVAESSMTAAAAQTNVLPETDVLQEAAVVETEGTAETENAVEQETAEQNEEDADEAKSGDDAGGISESVAETESEAESDTPAETESETTSETQTESESGTDEEAETGTEAVEEVETETEIETETATESEIETETEAETETETEIETETEEETEEETKEGVVEAASVSLTKPVIENITVAEDGRVSFTWDLVTDADGYEVYRKTSLSGTWEEIESGVTVGAEAVTFEDATAELGALYYYRVRAYQVVDESGKEEGIYSSTVNNKVELTGIAWSDEAFADIAMKKGETKDLSSAISYSPANATRSAVVWRSSNTEVVAVEDGVITAKGKGTALITASVGLKKVTANVSVSVDVEKVSLNKTEMNLREGAVGVLEAVIEPSDADATLVWSSSNPEIATVDNGVVRAKAVGTTVITATAGNISASCTVAVVVPVNKIVLEKTSLEIVRGGNSEEVAVTIEPSSATIRDIETEVADETLVNCEAEDGKVVLTPGEKLGTTTVKITVDGQSAVLTVNVVEEKTDTDDTSDVVAVRKLSFNLPETERTIVLETGEENDDTYQLTAEILPANASNKHITWTSSDEQVAVVSDSGLITAKGVGLAQITAKTDNGVYDRVTVLVENEVEEVVIDGNGTTLYCNADQPVFSEKTLYKTYDIRMTEAGLNCVYRSTNEEVATVDATGHVVAVAPGKTQIVALHPESGKSDAITVTVERLVEEITLPVSETTVAVGTQMKLAAVIGPEKVTNGGIEWDVVSATPSKCLVYDETRKVFVAKKAGTATITVMAKDKGKVKAEMLVTIEDVSPAATCSLTCEGKTKTTLKSGAQVQLGMTIRDKNGDDISLEYGKKTVVYKSSNEKAVVVDEDGVVTAVAGGTAKITASVMDGSNVSASCTITVEQRPEDIVFDREEYVIAPKGNVTLKPTILPANTKNKKVTWKVAEISVPADVEMTDAVKKTLITVNGAGKVTVSAKAPEGTAAIVRCTSSAFGKTETPLYKEVLISVGKTPVTSLKMNKTSLELTGLGAQETLEFTAKGANESTFYEWTSSNEEIISVDQNGVVTANAYGTAKITLCVDNAKTVTCTVAAYPVKKGQTIASAYTSYGIQQATNDGNDYVQLYFINKNTKQILNAELLNFTSSDPNLVYVDANGVAYANPRASITKDTNVTITATLKDDPFKRKATAKVTVWKEDQVKHMKFLYQADGEKDFVEITDHVEEKYPDNTTFKLRVETYDAESNIMLDAPVAFGISDGEMAEFVVDETDESGHTIIVTVKKAGKFKLTCMAKDKMAVNRQATFGMYAGTPVIKEASLGTINKAGEQTNGILLSDTIFTMVGANGTEIDGDDIDIESVQVKKTNGTAVKVDGNAFHIAQLDTSKFQLQVNSEAIKDVKPGTYNIVFEIERSYMNVESQWSDTTTETVQSTFKIADSVPSVKIPGVTVNSFERGTWTKLNINTTAKIENVTLVSEGTLAEYYEVMERQDGWYIAIKEDRFAICASKRIQGSFWVALEGYEKPVKVSTTVTAKSIKPSLKQLNVPDILVNQGTTAEITLYNNTTKQNLTDYQVALKTEKNKKWKFTNTGVEGAMRVELCNGDNEVDVATIKKAASYKQKVVVKKDGWRTPIELDVTVKVSPKAANPAITFDKKGVTLNTTVEENCTLAVKANKSNVTFKDGEWTFAVPAYADLFTAEYVDGKLTIGLKPEAVENKLFTKPSYNVQFVDVLNEEGYEKVKTAAVKVSIVKKAPTVSVKVTGKMDLLNRKASTLSATVSVTGLTAEIEDITLSNGTDSTFTTNFYSIQVKNKITIYARNAAELNTAETYKGKVKVTLKDGTVLEKDISLKLTQSIPKLKAVKTQTVYKAEADKVLDYNLNETMPTGVKIEEVVTRVLPAGFGVEYDNGHAYIVLNDDTIKPGQYTIQADVYFKGAQKIAGSENGKPVRVKINVQVKEQ